MRINKFFAAALAATTLLASCAKDENGVIEAEGQETFAGFTISIPTAPAGTRAGEEADLATTAESAIENVAVFVVGGSTVDKLYLTASDFTVAAGVATTTKAVLTTTGTKNIFVVANYTEALKTAIDNMGVGAFGQNAITLNESNFMRLATLGDLNSNMTSITMTGKVLNQALTAATNTETAALAAPIAVNVYRNLAKVVVREGVSPLPVTGGKHQTGTVEFGLAAKAQGAWLDNAENDGATTTAYSTVPAAALVDPAGASDVYWTNFSNPIVGTVATSWRAVSPFNAAGPTSTMLGWYAHENIYAGTLYSGSTTTARIRGKFIPNTLVTAYDATTGARTATDNSAVTTAVSFYRLNDGSYWNETAYTTAIAAGSFQIPATSFSAKYDGGIGYYSIVVMDDTRKPTVKRNNYYDLAINSIDGPGSPTEIPTDVDPFTPLEEESYVSVTVTVKNWWKQATGHDIQ